MFSSAHREWTYVKKAGYNSENMAELYCSANSESVP